MDPGQGADMAGGGEVGRRGAGPTVTIGMPVRNAEQHLRAGLVRLLAQTHQDLEIVVSDNASTDDTPAICMEVAARDPRVRYQRNSTNIGLRSNFQRVLDLATTPYFMWGCPDDRFDPTYVATMVAILEGDPAVVLAGSNAAAIDDDDAILDHFDNVGTFAGRSIEARAHRFIVARPGGGQATLFYGLMRTPVIQRVGYARRGVARHPDRDDATDLLTLFRLLFEGRFRVVDETLYFHRDTLLRPRRAETDRRRGTCPPSGPPLLRRPALDHRRQWPRRGSQVGPHPHDVSRGDRLPSRLPAATSRATPITGSPRDRAVGAAGSRSTGRCRPAPGTAPQGPPGPAICDDAFTMSGSTRPLAGRTPSRTRSNAWGERLHAVVPGGAHTYAKGDDQYPEGMAPVLVAGRGCRVRDVDGLEYIEYGSGLRAVTLGHAEPRVVRAAARAMRLGTNFVRPVALEAEAAEDLVRLIEAADMVKFAKNGSDVTTAAVRAGSRRDGPRPRRDLRGPAVLLDR